MRSVNLVILIGHLTRDPELRHTANGQPVATFSVATNRMWTTSNGEKQESTEYHDLVAWGKLAEICHQHITKGSAIYVQGRLHTRRWDAPDGTKKHKTEVVIQELNILSRKDKEKDDSKDEKNDDKQDKNNNNDDSVDNELASTKSDDNISPDIDLDLESSDLPGDNEEENK